MATPYSSTTWRVREGLEEEFVRRWTEFAQWSAEQGLAANAMLLRDIENPRCFVSFGPWESVEAIRRWRALPGFQEQAALLSEVIESFEPRTLELVADSGRRRRP